MAAINDEIMAEEAQQLRKLCTKDADTSGRVSRKEFEEMVSSVEFTQFLCSLGVELNNMQAFFELLNMCDREGMDNCIIGSFMSLIWSVLMLVIILFMFSLMLTQQAASCLAELPDDLDEKKFGMCSSFFGSVRQGMFAMFMACTE